MDKRKYEINLTTDNEEMFQKITDFIREVQNTNINNEMEILEINNFINTLAELVQAHYGLTGEPSDILERWCSHMLKSPMETKRAFVKCYHGHFEDIADDIMKLAYEHNALSNKGNKESNVLEK